MSFGADEDLSLEHSRAVAAAVREELARRRMSRQRLADEAKISISTLEKALSGRRPFTLATTVRLETALGVALRRREPGPTPAPGGFAPAALGSYARPAVGWLEGEYLTLRPSFETPGAVYAYLTTIAWDEAASSLMFRESRRLDAEFTQKGAVSLPHQSGHVYLVTNEHGQFRLAVLSRPSISGEMHGLLTTLQAGRGSQLTPTATPITLVPIRRAPDAAFGKIMPGDAAHGAYRAWLDRTLNHDFARFVP
jgi:transcriptional regulator with XRE-family HTH domain